MNDELSNPTGADERHSLQTYVSDLLALERHIEQPLKAQNYSGDTAKFAEALSLISEMRSINGAHCETLQATLDRLGGHAASPVKSAWSSLLGGVAAAVGGARKTKVTKWLRDDYTALNLAAMSYTLLHATATGLGDTSVANVARSGLVDYASLIMRINSIVPSVVLQELAEDGERVNPSAAGAIRRDTQDVWRSQSPVGV